MMRSRVDADHYVGQTLLTAMTAGSEAGSLLTAGGPPVAWARRAGAAVKMAIRLQKTGLIGLT